MQLDRNDLGMKVAFLYIMLARMATMKITRMTILMTARRHLFIGQAVQPRQVISIEATDVLLFKKINIVVHALESSKRGPNWELKIKEGRMKQACLPSPAI